MLFFVICSLNLIYKSFSNTLENDVSIEIGL
jgi:hypothetical protein